MSVVENAGGLVIMSGGGSIVIQSQGATFDYYLSPTGDDTLGNGSLGNPWSITALNSKHATYGGKRVGLLPGTYQYGTVNGTQTTLFSILSGQSGGGATCALQIQGGTAGTPTYVGSSDSSGHYSARTAIIDGSNPVGGGQPTGQGMVIGQSSGGSTAPSAFGYVTIDAIVVRNFNYAGIGFGSTPFSFPGIIIQNCEVYNGGGVSSANNPGGIFVWKQLPGGLITNCKIHDLQTIAGGANVPWGAAGIMFNQDPGTNEGFTATVDHCSIYKVGQCVTTKNNYSNVSIQYSYLELVNMGIYTGTAFPFAIYGAQQAPSTTVTYKYNIIMGGDFGHGEDGTNNAGTVNATNNTFYCGATGGNKPANVMFAYNNTSGAALNFNHNIVWSDGGYDSSGLSGPIGSIGFSGGGTNVFDYNYYGTGCTFGGAGGNDTNFTNWHNAGQDPHGSSISPTPFVTTPSSLNISSFVVSSSYLTASDSLPCGALNASGTAADGSGIVGCDF